VDLDIGLLVVEEEVFLINQDLVQGTLVLVVDLEDHMPVQEMVQDIMHLQLLEPVLFKILDLVVEEELVAVLIQLEVLEAMVVPVSSSSLILHKDLCHTSEDHKQLDLISNSMTFQTSLMVIE